VRLIVTAACRPSLGEHVPQAARLQGPVESRRDQRDDYFHPFGLVCGLPLANGRRPAPMPTELRAPRRRAVGTGYLRTCVSPLGGMMITRHDRPVGDNHRTPACPSGRDEGRCRQSWRRRSIPTPRRDGQRHRRGPAVPGIPGAIHPRWNFVRIRVRWSLGAVANVHPVRRRFGQDGCRRSSGLTGSVAIGLTVPSCRTPSCLRSPEDK
jgi:hypothetical protein